MKSTFQLLVVVLLSVCLLACSSSEEKAESIFAEIEQNSTQSDSAEVKYQQLITDYPDTEAAQKAEQQLELILEQRARTEKKEVFKAVESISRVVTGYKSLFQTWPDSIKDFDNGDYFFDSAYMAESVSEGVQVYLALTADETGYRLWALPEAKTSSYRLAGNGLKLVETDRAEVLDNIAANYTTEIQKGALTFLTPKTGPL